MAYASAVVPPHGLTGPPLRLQLSNHRPVFRADSRGPSHGEIALLPPSQVVNNAPPVVLDESRHPLRTLRWPRWMCTVPAQPRLSGPSATRHKLWPSWSSKSPSAASSAPAAGTCEGLEGRHSSSPARFILQLWTRFSITLTAFPWAQLTAFSSWVPLVILHVNFIFLSLDFMLHCIHVP